MNRWLVLYVHHVIRSRRHRHTRCAGSSHVGQRSTGRMMPMCYFPAVTRLPFVVSTPTGGAGPALLTLHKYLQQPHSSNNPVWRACLLRPTNNSVTSGLDPNSDSEDEMTSQVLCRFRRKGAEGSYEE
jgi:hypothetical protein